MKVLNWKSTNEVELNNNKSFPSNSNVNSIVKLAEFNLNSNQIKSVLFMCTMNSSPFQGIHFETENNAVKELIINNFLKNTDGSELNKRTDLPFPSEFLDLKVMMKQDDEVKFDLTSSGVQLIGSKLFTNANNKNVGWGISFDQEIEGKLKKVSMCGELNYQKKDGNWVE